MKGVTPILFFGLGVFAMVTIYLCKDYIGTKFKNLHQHVSKGRSQTAVVATEASYLPNQNDSYVFSWPSCEQNTAVANVSGFSSLPEHIQDFLYYHHCRHFPMLLDVPDKCGGADKSAEVFLLLVIKSSPGNYERREVLRKTWAKERLESGMWIRLVFLSGTTDSGHEKQRLNKLLEMEHQEYHDILQWDFRDTFYNLTLKQYLFMEWMHRNCPNVRFLFNGDEDVFVNTDNMVRYFQNLKDNDGSKHLFAGYILQSTGPIRSPGSKYYIPVQVQESNRYPPYCGGGGFVLSGYTATVIYNMSKSIPIHPIDDVYMGMCLEKAGLSPESHMGVRLAGLYIPTSRLDAYDPCYFKEVLVVHRFHPPHMFLLWKRIHDPELKCGKK